MRVISEREREKGKAYSMEPKMIMMTMMAEFELKLTVGKKGNNYSKFVAILADLLFIGITS